MSANGNEIAVLLLCHAAPEGLGSLARFFADSGFDLFAHVDAKVDEAPFRAQAPWVQFISPRLEVFWRGFSMVEATVALIEAARARWPYARYMLLSDDTVPLQSLSLIRNALLGDEEFAAFGPVEAHRGRYEGYFLFDSPATQLRWIPGVQRVVTPGLIARVKRAEALMARGKAPLPVFWYGSQWMALTAPSIERILARWHSDEWLRESFAFADAPDESYFQTILGEQLGRIDRGLVYVDWSTPEPPRVFTEISALEAVEPGGFMFLRKARLAPEALRQWVDRLRG